jgi:hypothetical protein
MTSTCHLWELNMGGSVTPHSDKDIPMRFDEHDPHSRNGIHMHFD